MRKQTECWIHDCDNTNTKGLGLCSKHYERQRVHGSPYIRLKVGLPKRPVMPCLSEGCKNVATERGLCHPCYCRTWRRMGPFGNKRESYPMPLLPSVKSCISDPWNEHEVEAACEAAAA